MLLLCLFLAIGSTADGKETKAEALRHAGVDCYEKERYAEAIDLLVSCMD